jgi:hypothetical protein
MYAEPAPMTPEQILCTIPQAARAVSRGTTWVYCAISDGLLKAVKSDRRTLVVVESLREYAANLPPAQITIPPSIRAIRARRARRKAAQNETVHQP